jgi:hypothetical protein
MNASVELLSQRNDDASGSADVAEPVAVLVLLQRANAFDAVEVKTGKDIVDVVDGEHDATNPQRVRGCIRPGADRRRRVELRQFESAVAVRSPHHGDVSSGAFEPD